MKEYEYFVDRLPGAGDVIKNRLIEYYGNAGEVYNAFLSEDKDIEDAVRMVKSNFNHTIPDVIKWARTYDLSREYAKLETGGIVFLTTEDERYPQRLTELDLPPYALYAKGHIPEDDVPAVAIIGARDCSEYGTFVADSFGEALAHEGINIISGMARGIDGISQRGALKAGGKTYAVLGNGVDICYPSRNINLYKEIQEKGGILSVFPPGTQPMKTLFPQRNKIVAALADMVLVIEARQKSGTSITVDLALKMGKDVYAVPGRLTDRLSDGCNVLIRDGAGVALSPEDVLRELAVIWSKRNPGNECITQKSIGKLDLKKPKEDTGVLKYLDFTPQSIETIHQLRLAQEKNVTISQTMSELVMLCIEGRAVQIGTDYFYKTAPNTVWGY